MCALSNYRNSLGGSNKPARACSMQLARLLFKLNFAKDFAKSKSKQLKEELGVEKSKIID